MVLLSYPITRVSFVSGLIINNLIDLSPISLFFFLFFTFFFFLKNNQLFSSIPAFQMLLILKKNDWTKSPHHFCSNIIPSSPPSEQLKKQPRYVLLSVLFIPFFL
jgi:hypothetical protein